MATGFVYFFKADGTNRYKIGLTNNLDRRSKEINRGQAPFPVTLQWSIAVNDTHAAETKLHHRFSENRRHGEWFEFTDSQLSEVKQAYSEIAGEYPNIPVFNKPIEVPQYSPEYFPQSPPPNYRSLDRDSHFPWIELIVIMAIAAWVGNFVKIAPIPLKTWALPNGPSFTLPSMPEIKIPEITLPDFKMPSIFTITKTIVITKRANIRSAPNGPILCVAEQNEMLQSTGVDGQWVKVEACNGKDGFVYRSLTQ
jgi:hypothetical protein